MTTEERADLKMRVHLAQLHRVNVFVAEEGAEVCDYCNVRIRVRRPGKRFCSDVCRKREGDRRVLA